MAGEQVGESGLGCLGQLVRDDIAVLVEDPVDELVGTCTVTDGTCADYGISLHAEADCCEVTLLRCDSVVTA